MQQTVNVGCLGMAAMPVGKALNGTNHLHSARILSTGTGHNQSTIYMYRAAQPETRNSYYNKYKLR